MLLGIVLGVMMEDNLKRAMLLSRGDPMIFFERPISAVLLGLSFMVIVVPPMVSAVRRRLGGVS
jgi:TctA family transporter